MLQPLEPFFCPCCTPAMLHTLTQSGLSPLSHPLNLLGTKAIALVLRLDQRTQAQPPVTECPSEPTQI